MEINIKEMSVYMTFSFKRKKTLVQIKKLPFTCKCEQ